MRTEDLPPVDPEYDELKAQWNDAMNRFNKLIYQVKRSRRTMNITIVVNIILFFVMLYRTIQAEKIIRLFNQLLEKYQLS